MRSYKNKSSKKRSVAQLVVRTRRIHNPYDPSNPIKGRSVADNSMTQAYGPKPPRGTTRPVQTTRPHLPDTSIIAEVGTYMASFRVPIGPPILLPTPGQRGWDFTKYLRYHVPLSNGTYAEVTAHIHYSYQTEQSNPAFLPIGPSSVTGNMFISGVNNYQTRSPQWLLRVYPATHATLVRPAPAQTTNVVPSQAGASL